MTKVWRKSVNRYWRYRGNIKLPRESRTDGRTHRQRHGRTIARKHRPGGTGRAGPKIGVTTIVTTCFSFFFIGSVVEYLATVGFYVNIVTKLIKFPAWRWPDCLLASLSIVSLSLDDLTVSKPLSQLTVNSSSTEYVSKLNYFSFYRRCTLCVNL